MLITVEEKLTISLSFIGHFYFFSQKENNYSNNK